MTPRIAADVALGESFQASALARAEYGDAKVVFLTGSTGFLGVHLLQELLKRKDLVEIVCLVRAPDDEQARARLLETLAVHAPGGLGDIEGVRAVAGDISKPRLGISDAKYDRIAREADAVFHCAAQVNLVYPYRHLRNTNVLGTCEVLRLATSGKPKAFHHVSSLAVAASAPAPGCSYAPETFRIPSVDGINSGYIQSKWVAEQLVNSAAQGGLSVCIYRPGLITGHSRSGACNPHDALSLMLHACLQLRAAPDSWERVYLTPVDYVSQAVCELSRQRGSGSKAFHIVNSRYIPWRRITEALAECLDVDRTLPYRDWLAHLVSRATDGADASLSALASLLPATLETGNSEPRRYHDTNTRQGLAAAPHLRFPDNDVAVLMKQLQWLRVSGRPTGALCSAPEGQ